MPWQVHKVKMIYYTCITYILHIWLYISAGIQQLLFVLPNYINLVKSLMKRAVAELAELIFVVMESSEPIIVRKSKIKGYELRLGNQVCVRLN